MTDAESAARRRTRRPRRSRRWRRAAAVAAMAVLVFALGVALGMALQDRPSPGGEQTIERTLEPLPQQTAGP